MKGQKKKKGKINPPVQNVPLNSHCFSIKDSIWTKNLKDEEPGAKEAFADQLIPPASQGLG